MSLSNDIRTHPTCFFLSFHDGPNMENWFVLCRWMFLAVASWVGARNGSESTWERY